MHNYNSNGSSAASARGFIALWAMLAMGLGLTRPAEAAPFAYVTGGAANVSVIDTATNTVVATVTVGTFPFGVAVSPDAKRAYVANQFFNTVSVIDTASNTVISTVPVGLVPVGVAITPDGTRAYVTNASSNTVSVIDTASNMVVATIPVGTPPGGVAITPDGTHAYVTGVDPDTVSVIVTAANTVVATVPVAGGAGAVAVTPDGKHVYVTNFRSNTVSVIDTATNTVEAATLAVGTGPSAIAVTPDGTHAYVANGGSNTVSVIATAANTVVATVVVGPLLSSPDGVAITPDGTHAYVTIEESSNLSVIATASNTVVATVPVGNFAKGVAIVPPPPGVPFLAFNATLTIDSGGPPPEDTFNLHSSFTLSSTAPGIHPVIEPVTFQVGTFSVTIPPGSFSKQPDGSFTFAGVINGVNLRAQITPMATLRYGFHATATDASLTGTANPVYVTLTIGGDSGATSVTATISP